MKNLIMFLLSAICGYSQTILNSIPVTLKKPSESRELFCAADNNGGQLYVFASDKEKVRAFHYNSAIFIRDSLSFPRPDKKYTGMAGYSIHNNIPVIYWSSENSDKIMGVSADFNTGSIIKNEFEIDYKSETLIGTFSKHNIFYLLTFKDREPALKLYVFKDGKPQIRTVDLSGFLISDKQGKKLPVNELFELYAPVTIDADFPTPLFGSVSPLKIYPQNDRIIITSDHNPDYTQLFEVHLGDFSIRERKIPQQLLQRDSKSSSFILEDKIYQVTGSRKALAISAQPIDAPASLKVLTATENDSISFRNSPLLLQTGRQKPSELKSSKKFLKRISDSELAIAAYRTPDDILLTVGGVRNVSSAGDIMLGVALGVAVAAAGGGDIDGLFAEDTMQSAFFDALFDDEFNHKKFEPEFLAVDAVSRFLDQNEQADADILTRFGDYFILAYYDNKSKEVVLRRFTDGDSPR